MLLLLLLMVVMMMLLLLLLLMMMMILSSFTVVLRYFPSRADNAIADVRDDLTYRSKRSCARGSPPTPR
jgi:hypothetical protein